VATNHHPTPHAHSWYDTHPWAAAPTAPTTADTATIPAQTFCPNVSAKFLTSTGLPSQ
jgi:hypothetical protein